MKFSANIMTAWVATTAVATGAPHAMSANRNVPKDQAFITQALNSLDLSAVRECLATKEVMGFGARALLGKAAEGFESWHNVGSLVCKRYESGIEAVRLSGDPSGARNSVLSIAPGSDPALLNPDNHQRPNPYYKTYTLVYEGKTLITNQDWNVLYSSFDWKAHSLSSGAQRIMRSRIHELFAPPSPNN